MRKIAQIYDISVRLGDESIVYPGDPPYEREVVCSLAEGDACEVSRLTMSAHSGTHIDTPAHFLPLGKRLDDYPPDAFILPATVVEVAEGNITPDTIHPLRIGAGEALLFKTANSRTGRCRSGKFVPDYVYLTAGAATACVQKNVRMVGIDYITVEQPDNNEFPVHHTLLKNDILILEGLNLQAVPPGNYTLIALPLKIQNGEASPVRAVLIAS